MSDFDVDRIEYGDNGTYRFIYKDGFMSDWLDEYLDGISLEEDDE